MAMQRQGQTARLEVECDVPLGRDGFRARLQRGVIAKAETVIDWPTNVYMCMYVHVDREPLRLASRAHSGSANPVVGLK